jgi:hypothetical protein
MIQVEQDGDKAMDSEGERDFLIGVAGRETREEAPRDEKQETKARAI